MIEKAQHVFSLACKTHLPKKISLHIAWAKFEEKHGFRENAIKVLSDLENMHPEVVSIPMMKYGIYRRMWSLSKAGEAIQVARSNVQSRDNYVYLTMKLARFRAKVEGNFNAAYEVLQEALKKYPVNERLHTCMVDLEYSGRQVVNVKSFCEACDNVIDNSQMPMNSRLKFCQRKLEMLEDIGSELSEIENARMQYDELCKEQRGDMGVNSDEPPEKKARVTTSVSSSVTISAAPNMSSVASSSGGGDFSSSTPHTVTAGSTSSSAESTSSQYGGYYYPWSYYGSQSYDQQYWPPQTTAAVSSSTPAISSSTPVPSSSVVS